MRINEVIIYSTGKRERTSVGDYEVSEEIRTVEVRLLMTAAEYAAYDALRESQKRRLWGRKMGVLVINVMGLGDRAELRVTGDERAVRAKFRRYKTDEEMYEAILGLSQREFDRVLGH